MLVDNSRAPGLDDAWRSVSELAQEIIVPLLQPWLARQSELIGLSVSIDDVQLGESRTLCALGDVSDLVQRLPGPDGQTEIVLYTQSPLEDIVELPEGLAARIAQLVVFQQQLVSAQIFRFSPIIQYEAAELDGRWVLIQANPALGDFLGVDPAELEGRGARKVMIDFIHPDDVRMLMTSYDMTRTTSRQMTLQYRLLAADGVYYPVTERVLYISDDPPRRCISTIWHRELDQMDSQTQYQLFHDIQTTTADLSLLSGREFLHHFCRRLEALDDVDSLALIAHTRGDWWESWALYRRASQLPDFHIQLNHGHRLDEAAWNLTSLFGRDDDASQALYDQMPYQSVLPLKHDGESVVACLILGSVKPLSNSDQVVQLVRLLGIRVLREIRQVRIAEAQWEQNLQLQQQKQQLTRMVTLLGDLDTVADEFSFMRITEDQLRQTFNLQCLDWVLWVSGEWHRLTLEDVLMNRRPASDATRIVKPNWIEFLEQVRRQSEMVVYRGRLRVFWPVGSALDGFLVLVQTFRKSLPDRELLEFAQNSLTLAHQGLVQRENLRRQAMYDSLTGLGNRSQLHAWIKVALPVKERASLLLFDLNRFKEINDSFGHQFGDRLLCEIGPRISSTLGDREHYLSRLGGDEFALFLPDTDTETSSELAGKLHKALAKSYTIDGLRFQVEASIGVAQFPQHGDDGHELLRCADVAMYAAKHTNRSVVLFDPQLDNSTPMRIAVLSGLDQAIAEHQLSVAYQPLMQTSTGQVAGFEALVRWSHPEFGELSPSEFIPLAEVGEGIRKITDFVLRSTLEYLVVWRRLLPQMHVAVNISPRVLLDHDFPNRVQALLEAYNLPGESVVMELTESTLLVDPVRAVEIIHSLSALGVKVEIDDFGTGYSSLSYLKRLPLSALKIDRSFVADISSDSHNEVIVQSTVQMAHNLGLQVVAEGVEDEATLLKMMRLGCDMIQGYYFSKPIPGDEVEEWLKRNR
ncbi:GGDEF domain-containing phosphodiesterase [Reinekea blandensis]|uniref:Putative phosphodiesterase n=1 Tax=Reinekea blandensis MED297 TaxID=314283 RepID=A4BAQ7_9GAMM|nr:GGDEF domain-containing phosphodiesterase [Reinekea blandensis]EAR11013.1 putative phosphodiesterase [Reinekea sp. MED297] [Reinekea blandensis MED297]